MLKPIPPTADPASVRCFYHPDREAAGICKNCGKGLCAESAIDVGNGLACPGPCEKRVELIAATHGKADAMASEWTSFMGPGMVTVGAVFVAFGVYMWLALDDPTAGFFFALLGVLFGAGPGRQVVTARRGS